jgi:hypothetical protein
MAATKKKEEKKAIKTALVAGTQQTLSNLFRDFQYLWFYNSKVTVALSNNNKYSSMLFQDQNGLNLPKVRMTVLVELIHSNDTVGYIHRLI